MLIISWWRHQMDTFFALLALCDGNSPDEFSSCRPVTRSIDVFYDLRWTNNWANNRDRVIWHTIAPIMTSLQWCILQLVREDDALEDVLFRMCWQRRYLTLLPRVEIFTLKYITSESCNLKVSISGWRLAISWGNRYNFVIYIANNTLLT